MLVSCASVFFLTFICLIKGVNSKSFSDELQELNLEFNEYCSFSSHHLLCEEYDPVNRRSWECKENSFNIRPYSQNEKDTIVQYFNDYRTELAKGGYSFKYSRNETKLGEEIPYVFPAASNMLKIEWEPLLAIAAARKALTCSADDSCPECLQFGGKHMQGKELHPYGKKLGKGAYYSFISGEYRFFTNTAERILNYSRNEKYDFFTIPSYSQSRFIGCARVELTISIKGVVQNMLETCIMAPSEMSDNNLLYLQGETCSNCPTGFDCDEDHPALCKGGIGGLERHPIIENYHLTMNTQGLEKNVPNILNEVDYEEEEDYSGDGNGGGDGGGGDGGDSGDSGNSTTKTSAVGNSGDSGKIPSNSDGKKNSSTGDLGGKGNDAGDNDASTDASNELSYSQLIVTIIIFGDLIRMI